MTSYRTRNFAAAALAAMLACALTIGGASASDKLRVGKAQAQPFTFAPLDIGIEVEP